MAYFQKNPTTLVIVVLLLLGGAFYFLQSEASKPEPVKVTIFARSSSQSTPMAGVPVVFQIGGDTIGTKETDSNGRCSVIVDSDKLHKLRYTVLDTETHYWDFMSSSHYVDLDHIQDGEFVFIVWMRKYFFVTGDFLFLDPDEPNPIEGLSVYFYSNDFGFETMKTDANGRIHYMRRLPTDDSFRNQMFPIEVEWDIKMNDRYEVESGSIRFMYADDKRTVTIIPRKK